MRGWRDSPCKVGEGSIVVSDERSEIESHGCSFVEEYFCFLKVEHRCGDFVKWIKKFDDICSEKGVGGNIGESSLVIRCGICISAEVSSTLGCTGGCFCFTGEGAGASAALREAVVEKEVIIIEGVCWKGIAYLDKSVWSDGEGRERCSEGGEAGSAIG